MGYGIVLTCILFNNFLNIQVTKCILYVSLAHFHL